jgi:hypothetical protein
LWQVLRNVFRNDAGTRDVIVDRTIAHKAVYTICGKCWNKMAFK